MRLCSEALWQAGEDQPAQQCLSSNFLSKLRGPALSSTQINGCALSQVDHAQTVRQRRQRPPGEIPQLSLSLPPQSVSHWSAHVAGLLIGPPLSVGGPRRGYNFHDGQQRLKVKLKTELQSWAGLEAPALFYSLHQKIRAKSNLY